MIKGIMHAVSWARPGRGVTHFFPQSLAGTQLQGHVTAKEAGKSSLVGVSRKKKKLVLVNHSSLCAGLPLRWDWSYTLWQMMILARLWLGPQEAIKGHYELLRVPPVSS